jgi:DNA-binding winged helix-turn-helix (wHTH) protein
MAAGLEPKRMICTFDGFQLDARKRLLLRDGESVPLKSKVFDLLLALVESGGREITKKELMERVWPNSSEHKYIAPTVMAVIYGALGDKTQAFELLNKAFSERDFLLVMLNVEPMFSTRCARTRAL